MCSYIRGATVAIRGRNVFREEQKARTGKLERTRRRTRLPPEREESGSPRSTVQPSGFESGNHRPRDREPRSGTKTGTFRTVEGRSRSAPVAWGRVRTWEDGVRRIGRVDQSDSLGTSTPDVKPATSKVETSDGPIRRHSSTLRTETEFARFWLDSSPSVANCRQFGGL